MTLCGQRLSFTASSAAGCWRCSIAFIVNSKNRTAPTQSCQTLSLLGSWRSQYIHFTCVIVLFMTEYDSSTILWPCLNAISLVSPYPLFIVIISLLSPIGKKVTSHAIIFYCCCWLSFQYCPQCTWSDRMRSATWMCVINFWQSLCCVSVSLFCVECSLDLWHLWHPIP